MRERLERAARRLQARDLDGAERDLRRVLQDSPGDPVAHNLLGLVHLERPALPEALTEFATAIRLRDPYPEALVNLAVACNRSGQHELALAACAKVLEHEPRHALALVNQGMAWKGLRLLDEAKRSFDLARPHPKALYNLGHVLLLEDDLERGLPLLEHRRGLLRTGAGLAGEPWDGTPRPADTLLVIPEQGLGDFLLMSRFFPALADRFARVVVHAPVPLARLLAAQDPRLDVVTSLDERTWDCWAPIMSLPLLTGVRSLAELPTAPWLRAPDAVAPAPPAGRPLRVGVNWAGNPAYAYDAVRSTPLDAFADLLALPGVEWVSLHRGVREAEAEAFGLPQPLREARDFLDTAGVIAGLDAVVSTETAVPNLSAALGVPTCVMSVRDVDWRWTGWYRGVTVCAQEASGDWGAPVAAAAEVLRALAPAVRSAA